MADDGNRPLEADNLGLLMHVPLQLTVELGACKMSVAEILKLGTGSIVELDRPADHRSTTRQRSAIARGEIVAVDESFGLRITELLPNRRSP